MGQLDAVREAMQGATSEPSPLEAPRSVNGPGADGSVLPPDDAHLATLLASARTHPSRYPARLSGAEGGQPWPSHLNGGGEREGV